jgi:hypothetical protein
MRWVLFTTASAKQQHYPRAEVRYLPQSLISDVPRIIAGLRVGQSFSAIPVPEPPVIRKGASGTFYDKGLEGASHHAVIPNVNTIDKLPEVWPRLSSDEKKLFDVIARAYMAALMPDFVTGRQPQSSMCAASNSVQPVASPLISAGEQHSRSGNPPTKRAMRRNCCHRCATARPRNCKI